MKDKNHLVNTAAEPGFTSSHASNGTRQASAAQDQFLLHDAAPSKVPETNDKLNRRYSFDDNGGGYSGL